MFSKLKSVLNEKYLYIFKKEMGILDFSVLGGKLWIIATEGSFSMFGALCCPAGRPTERFFLKIPDFFRFQPKSNPTITFGRKLGFHREFHRLKVLFLLFSTVKRFFKSELSTETYGRITLGWDFPWKNPGEKIHFWKIHQKSRFWALRGPKPWKK